MALSQAFQVSSCAIGGGDSNLDQPPTAVVVAGKDPERFWVPLSLLVVVAWNWDVPTAEPSVRSANTKRD